MTPRGFFGSGNGRQMSAGTLNCQRSAPTVDQCSNSGAGNGTCEQTEVAGVICQGKVHNDIIHNDVDRQFIY